MIHICWDNVRVQVHKIRTLRNKKASKSCLNFIFCCALSACTWSLLLVGQSVHCKSRLIKKYVAEPHCTLELHWYNICGFSVKKAQLRCIWFIGALICTFGMAENFVFWNLYRCLGIFYGWLASLAALCSLCCKNEPTRFYLYFCFQNIHLENIL